MKTLQSTDEKYFFIINELRIDAVKFSSLGSRIDSRIPDIIRDLCGINPEMCRIVKKSIDSRRGRPEIIYKLVIQTGSAPNNIKADKITPEQAAEILAEPEIEIETLKEQPRQPVVAGTGPAGIFAGLVLALAGAVEHTPACVLMVGVGRISSQITEVLYARDVDIARGNSHSVFLAEDQLVIVALGWVGGDDCQVLIGNGSTGYEVIFRNVFRVSRGVNFYIAGYCRDSFPFDDTVAHVVFLAYDENTWSGIAARRKQSGQDKQIIQISIHHTCELSNKNS